MRESSGIAAEFSFENEKAIAKSFSQRFQWEMILIGLGQAAIWLSLWPLVLNGFLDLWLGFLIASLCACFAYLPSHEAQHGNYSRGNPKLKWLDGFVGPTNPSNHLSLGFCLLYTSPSPRDRSLSRMPSSA